MHCWFGGFPRNPGIQVQTLWPLLTLQRAFLPQTSSGFDGHATSTASTEHLLEIWKNTAISKYEITAFDFRYSSISSWTLAVRGAGLTFHTQRSPSTLLHLTSPNTDVLWVERVPGAEVARTLTSVAAGYVYAFSVGGTRSVHAFVYIHAIWWSSLESQSTDALHTLTNCVTGTDTWVARNRITWNHDTMKRIRLQDTVFTLVK